MTLPQVDTLTVFHQAILSALQESNSIDPLEVVAISQRVPTSVSIEVAGVIGLNSPGFKGTFSLQFPKNTILKLISTAGKTESTEHWAEAFTGLVLKNAESRFQSLEAQTRCALPNILSGKTLDSLGSHNAKSWNGLEFRLPDGNFWALLETNPQGLLPPGHDRSPSSPKNWKAEALLEFVKAVRKTLEVQFSTLIDVGAPFKKNENAFTFDVGSMIGVTDGDFSGYFGMYYQKSAFLGLMSTLLGTEYTELSEDIQDGASEITNICFGVAKQVLNDQGHSIQMALPYLIRGTGISSAGSSSGRTAIAVPLSTPQGKFWIEFGYKEA